MAKIKVTCPNCSAQYSVDDSHAGKQGRCQKCKATFVIGNAASPAASIQATKAAEAQSGPFRAAEDGVPAVWKEGDLILDLYEVKGVLG